MVDFIFEEMNVRNCHDFPFVMLVFTFQFQTTGNQYKQKRGRCCRNNLHKVSVFVVVGFIINL